MRLLLDTNVWGMLVDHDAVQQLRRVTRDRGAEVMVCPAVVYELLRTRDPMRRQAQLKAATLGVWTRMRTEVYVECEDVRRAITLRHPEWLRPAPDLAAYHQLRADWSPGGGFWRRARKDTDGEATRLAWLEGDVLARARDEARQRRDEMGEAHFDSVPLEGWKGRPKGGHMPGWAGEDVDVWRLMSTGIWWSALDSDARAAYLDWLGPFLDLGAMAAAEASFNRMWLDELDVTEVPREWLRWAVMLLQSVRKVTPGTPGDNQIACYAYDADVIVSGDKAILEILDRVRPCAPMSVAATWQLRPNDDPVEQIAEALYDLR